MRTIVLSGAPGLERVAQWRVAARALLAAQVPPDAVGWSDGEARSLALGDPSEPRLEAAARVPRLPRDSVELLERVGCHRDPTRFAQMYAALWRLARGERHLLDLRHDALVQSLLAMDAAVRREMHKTKAFVRFEPRAESGAMGRAAIGSAATHFAAWFEPEHDALELVLPFFERRFANMAWAILTPRLCVRWDGVRSHRTPGIARPADAAGGDPLAAAWPIYYASIFNPARLKVGAMVKEMPKRYWPNLPEARLIPQLVAGARAREAEMIAREARGAARPSGYTPAARPPLDRCTRCEHAARATQAVAGEGPADARIVIVGEQPGDQEDLVGRPFVGPAGQVLDAALAAASLGRGEVYLTNAVKHFSWELRGKRRLHKTPGQREVLACRDHLLAELAALAPRVIVALGRVALRALAGGTALECDRGVPARTPNGLWIIASHHPAYALRAGPDGARVRDELAGHLRAARALAAAEPKRPA